MNHKFRTKCLIYLEYNGDVLKNRILMESRPRKKNVQYWSQTSLNFTYNFYSTDNLDISLNNAAHHLLMNLSAKLLKAQKITL